MAKKPTLTKKAAQTINQTTLEEFNKRKPKAFPVNDLTLSKFKAFKRETSFRE
ncbi:hypothetical protein N5853_00170 [Bartonella sp. HY329]|uniref:hypothetical protein n=1 Tax=unclassified Bartonella TaxID=2645622 RepID=UPI0021C817B4|nr:MULTISPECIES: hypothetical protein [unclassified Bartonella]UXM95117.1 hypothetical protein N5853_00170 [Bartonella sp. HY329]UXN09440.1 hypothetical protein N5852_00175 [Bartonella sp. HY328]